MTLHLFIAYVPLASLLLGGLAGLGLGRYAAPRIGLWMLAGFVLISVALLIRMAAIGPGEEAEAFGPFVALTGGVFPALFGGIMGWLGGRALGKRAAR